MKLKPLCTNMRSATHPVYGNVLAYEVDGFGNQLFMDDANVPSLLALPYLGAMQLTIRFIRVPASWY